MISERVSESEDLAFILIDQHDKSYVKFNSGPIGWLFLVHQKVGNVNYCLDRGDRTPRHAQQLASTDSSDPRSAYSSVNRAARASSIITTGVVHQSTETHRI